MNRPKTPSRFNGYAKLEHGSAWVQMRRDDVAGHYVEHQDYAELVAYANYLEEKNMDLRKQELRLRSAIKNIDPLLLEAIDSASLAK